ncbi:MAG: alanine racemase [Cyclobacteriaceae bacterium]|nr:alanine racemase [Cyclobacteriaceae bacterium]
MFKNSDPILLIDEQKVKKNLKRMHEKVLKSGAHFRPHFKTHQSLQIGKLFQEEGIKSITVSSMGMAEYFGGYWDDITIAFPFNILQLDRLNTLLEKQFVHIMVDSPELVDALLGKVDMYCGVWIEIETGNKRTGIDPNRIDEIRAMVEKISNDPYLEFTGFYSHPGHSYTRKGKEAVLSVFNETVSIMNKLKSQFDIEGIQVNVGDTPSSSHTDSFEGVDSVSCGNFIFYDMMQVNIESCKAEDVAVCLTAPVVSISRERKEIAVLAGGIHLSKEKMELNGQPFFGSVVLLEENHWGEPLQDCYIKSISQEHGVIKASDELLERVKIGDVLGVLPVHSCMTADCMGKYYDFEGNVIDHFSMRARDRD